MVYEEEEKIVEAIQDGRIIRATEAYAKREGLAILRRPVYQEAKKTMDPRTEEKQKRTAQDFKLGLKESIYTPPSWKEKQVTSELVPNFNWLIRTERKKRNLTKSQLARMIHDKEENIKLIEFGKLPSEDFVLINKLQNFFNVNLRKDGRRDFTESAYKLLQEKSPPTPPAKKDYNQNEMKGSDIELSASDLL
jgi:ribosome-binding protein aMBF1 (putative translation factor)